MYILAGLLAGAQVPAGRVHHSARRPGRCARRARQRTPAWRCAWQSIENAGAQVVLPTSVVRALHRLLGGEPVGGPTSQCYNSGRGAMAAFLYHCSRAKLDVAAARATNFPDSHHHPSSAGDMPNVSSSARHDIRHISTSGLGQRERKVSPSNPHNIPCSQ